MRQASSETREAGAFKGRADHWSSFDVLIKSIQTCLLVLKSHPSISLHMKPNYIYINFEPRTNHPPLETSQSQNLFCFRSWLGLFLAIKTPLTSGLIAAVDFICSLINYTWWKKSAGLRISCPILSPAAHSAGDLHILLHGMCYFFRLILCQFSLVCIHLN
jgi:hypothetical protein